MTPTSPMPDFKALRDNHPEQFDQMVDFVFSLKADMPKEDASNEAPSESD